MFNTLTISGFFPTGIQKIGLRFPMLLTMSKTASPVYQQQLWKQRLVKYERWS